MTIKELRFRNRLTQFDLRMLTGISQSKISILEHGYMKPTDKELKSIALATNISPDEIEV